MTDPKGYCRFPIVLHYGEGGHFSGRRAGHLERGQRIARFGLELAAADREADSDLLRPVWGRLIFDRAVGPLRSARRSPSQMAVRNTRIAESIFGDQRQGDVKSAGLAASAGAIVCRAAQMESCVAAGRFSFWQRDRVDRRRPRSAIICGSSPRTETASHAPCEEA